jgi:hypothetical protein
MREAFVIRLTEATEPDRKRFVGWVEEVDTGCEYHFKSTDELLGFMGQCVGRSRLSRKPSPTEPPRE